jgi:hypothetical protein
VTTDPAAAEETEPVTGPEPGGPGAGPGAEDDGGSADGSRAPAGPEDEAVAGETDATDTGTGTDTDTNTGSGEGGASESETESEGPAADGASGVGTAPDTAAQLSEAEAELPAQRS